MKWEFSASFAYWVVSFGTTRRTMTSLSSAPSLIGLISRGRVGPIAVVVLLAAFVSVANRRPALGDGRRGRPIRNQLLQSALSWLAHEILHNLSHRRPINQSSCLFQPVGFSWFHHLFFFLRVYKRFTVYGLRFTIDWSVHVPRCWKIPAMEFKWRNVFNVEANVKSKGKRQRKWW